MKIFFGKPNSPRSQKRNSQKNIPEDFVVSIDNEDFAVQHEAYSIARAPVNPFLWKPPMLDNSSISRPKLPSSLAIAGTLGVLLVLVFVFESMQISATNVLRKHMLS